MVLVGGREPRPAGSPAARTRAAAVARAAVRSRAAAAVAGRAAGVAGLRRGRRRWVAPVEAVVARAHARVLHHGERLRA